MRHAEPRSVSPNSESAESREYVANWLRQVPEFAAELGIDLSRDIAGRLTWLGSGGRADAVLIKAPESFRIKSLRGKRIVLKVTNDRAQAMVSQAAVEDEPLGVVPVYDVVETDVAPRVALPELPGKRGEEPFYTARTWGILEKVVMPLEAAYQLEGILVAGETPTDLLRRYEATVQAYERGGRAQDPLVEEWRLQYEAAIEWIEETCAEVVKTPALLDLHAGNWGVDPESGDLCLLDLGQCYVPTARDLASNPRPKIEPGSTLVLERYPVYDHGPGHVPSGKKTKKVVKSIRWSDDGSTGFVRLVGMQIRTGGMKVDRPFRLTGNEHDGFWLSSGEKPPLRYSVEDILPPK